MQGDTIENHSTRKSNMFKNRSIAIILSIFAFSCSTVVSAENYVECDNCNAGQIHQKVISWISKNHSIGDVTKSVKKNVHVIDLTKGEVQSFQTLLQAVPGPIFGNQPPRMLMLPKIEGIVPPKNILNMLDNVRTAKAQLKSDAENLVIPESIIADAWDFVNCAYCESAVQDYFNNSLSGQIETVSLTITEVAQAFNLVASSIPDQYRVPLEAGGYVTFKVALLKNESEIIIELTKIVDIDGNNIPMNASQLPNLILHINDTQRNVIINRYLSNFNFMIPPHIIGRVTIIDCGVTRPGQCASGI